MVAAVIVDKDFCVTDLDIREFTRATEYDSPLFGGVDTGTCAVTYQFTFEICDGREDDEQHAALRIGRIDSRALTR